MLFSFLVMSVWERMPALLSMGHFFLNGTWNSYFSRAVTTRHAVRQDHHALRRVPAGSVLNYSVHDLIVSLTLPVRKSVFIANFAKKLH